MWKDFKLWVETVFLKLNPKFESLINGSVYFALVPPGPLTPENNKIRISLPELGFEFIEDKNGGQYWYRPEYKRNAEILAEIYNKQNLKPVSVEIRQSLLMGKSITNIIKDSCLLEIYDFVMVKYASYDVESMSIGIQHQLEDKYNQLITVELEKLTPLLNRIKNELIQQGAIINNN